MTRIRIRAALLSAGALGLLMLAGAAGATTRGGSAPALRNGGTLVVGLANGEPDVLDPTLARTFSGREVFLTFCEKLYDLNAKAQIVPQLAKLGDTFATNPICAGPFTYQNRVAGDSITVVKSANYYAKKKVHLSKIIFKVQNDTAAAAAALRAGDTQALDAIDSTQLQSI